MSNSDAPQATDSGPAPAATHSSAGGRPKAPVDASMTLLNEVMHRPLDPGYATAARKKARQRELGISTEQSKSTKVGAAVLAVVIGFVSITAVISLRSRDSIAASTRAALSEEISSRNEKNDSLEAQILDLNKKAEELQTALLAGQGKGADQLLESDQIRNGTLAVTGPGLVVTLEDGPNSIESPENRVQDTDVRAVVSGLWGAGAEAVAVNGKRLTATSAIRSAGDAILVDLTGLSEPYVVEAIGDPKTLEVRFAQQIVATQLSILKERYGINSDIAPSQELNLPAGTTRSLINAHVITAADGTDTGDDSTRTPLNTSDTQGSGSLD